MLYSGAIIQLTQRQKLVPTRFMTIVPMAQMHNLHPNQYRHFRMTNIKLIQRVSVSTHTTV